MLFFVFLTPIFGLEKTDLKCLKKTDDNSVYGSLQYSTYEHWDCIELLHKTTDLTNCAVESRIHKTETEVKCQVSAVGFTCPDAAPLGCKIKSGVSTGDNPFYCDYLCSNQALTCSSNDDHLIEMTPNPTDPKNKIACFNKDFYTCETGQAKTDEQLVYSCDQPKCGYLMTNESFSITFDSTDGIINTYENKLGPNVGFNAFNCGQTENYPDGCICDYDDSKTETTLTCKDAAYTFKCVSDGNMKCLANKCYKGEPIMDYKYDNCGITNEHLHYCTEDIMVYLPCGNYEHICSPVTGGYDCTCYDMPDAASCEKLDGVYKQATLTDKSQCELKTIDNNQDMMECDMTCFDISYDQEDCLDDNEIFASTYWQCYDNFQFFRITNPEKADGFNKAEKMKGSHKELNECYESIWNNGFYKCDDSVLSKSENYCDEYGEYYVNEKKDSKIVLYRSENLPAPYEFKCLSYSAEFKAVNNINPSVDLKSECYELEEPSNNGNATCPDVTGCSIIPVKLNSTSIHGFNECQCEKECTYKCNSSKYDPVFPEDFTDEQQKAREYTTYDCKKDNLVMIICTSIFVPLGVAGIAAGVYFFFFHESSEVAPVETDNELASTRNSEHDSTEEDKEETHSEITKNN